MSLQDNILFRSESIQGRPALMVALFFIAGIVAGNLFPTNGFTLPLFIPTIVLFLIVFLSRRSLYFTLLSLSLIFFFGYLKYQSDYSFVNLRFSEEIKESSQYMIIWGMVVDRPQFTDERTRLIVRTDSLFDGRFMYHLTADVIVSIRRHPRIDQAKLNVEYGDYISTVGLVAIPEAGRNPYDIDYNRFLRLNNISYIVSAHGYFDVEVIPSHGGNILFRSIIVPIRSYISERIEHWVGGESGNFLRGLLLGDRSRIGDETREAFVRAGVIHVLAVSGLHVGLVTVIFLSVFGLLRAPQYIRVLLTICGLIIFAFVTGAAPSVVRATIMASVILVGFLLPRKSDIYNSIAVAALILLLFDTRDLFKPSFQLSFAAVISIVYLYPKLWSFVYTKFPAFSQQVFVKPVLQLFLVSFAAQIGTAPFTAYYFERVSIIAFFANLIVVPSIAIILSFGFAMVLMSLISQSIGKYYAVANEFVLSNILSFIDKVSNFSFSSFEIYNISLIHFFIFYSVIILLVSVTDASRFRRIFLVILGVVTVYTYFYAFTFQPDESACLRMTVIDVGQGDAVLLEFPNGEVMLYDGGPRTMNYDAGERIVVPFLKRHGINYIDAIVVSHPHADHYGGLPAVVREIDVGIVYSSGQPTHADWYLEFIDELEQKGIEKHHVRAGDIIDGFENSRVYVVHPAPLFVQPEDDRSHWNVNNASVVLLVQYGNTRFLLSGDAEIEAEYYMAHYFGDFLNAEILKAGHHGSRTSSTEKYLQIVNPDKALISAGRFNRFNHPHESVIQRFEDYNITVYRTDLDGAIIVEACGESYSVTAVRREEGDAR